MEFCSLRGVIRPSTGGRSRIVETQQGFVCYDQQQQPSGISVLYDSHIIESLSILPLLAVLVAIEAIFLCSDRRTVKSNTKKCTAHSLNSGVSNTTDVRPRSLTVSSCS